MSTDKQLRPNANDAGISERRRQMLRAAATAAPLVATLPSGAAWANASAFQCQAKDKEATDGLSGESPNDVEPGGHWLVGTGNRLECLQFTTNNGGNIPANQDGTPYTIYEIDGTYYRCEGVDEDVGGTCGSTTMVTAVYPNDSNLPSNAEVYIIQERTDNVALLRFFTVGDHMTAPTDCEGGAISLAEDPPISCVYPLTKRNDNNAFTALNDSCMTSVIIYTMNNS